MKQHINNTIDKNGKKIKIEIKIKIINFQFMLHHKYK